MKMKKKKKKGLGNLPCEERQEELGFFGGEERSRGGKAQGNFIAVFQYLKSIHKEHRESPFTRSHTEKTRGNEC